MREKSAAAPASDTGGKTLRYIFPAEGLFSGSFAARRQG